MKYLITGGTGFLGEALVRRLLKDDHGVVVYSRDEYKQSEMQRKLGDRRISYWLGDVRNLERLKEAVVGVDVIIHCAAMKRMDQVSHNVYEIADVNITGTKNVVEAGKHCKKIIFVSTDKAYAPSCVYGASKLIAESIVLSSMKGVVWRFGNFKWSRGSVWEIFKEQAAQRVPLTMTDPEATRFVMEIDEVCDYILSETTHPGLFYPQDLKAMSVRDIAVSVCHPESEFKVIGLREGEKKHEAFNENYSSDKCL